MATTITFNDGAAASLDNGKTAPGDRFTDWTPTDPPIGESANPQGSPVRTMFRFRTDKGARFKLPMIPSSGANSKLTIAQRLKTHLENGGTCVVNTGDAAGSSYATCCLRPGTTPSLELTDKANMEYTLELDLVNTAGAAMVCRYNG